jgi:NADH-quinone oxidoreductase subunit H
MILVVVLSIVLSVALMTLAERKVMAVLQRRIGPNKLKLFNIASMARLVDQGLLQPFVDGVKLVLKESVVPLESSNWLFIATPFIAFYLALLNWLVLPLAEDLALSELIGGGILLIIANSELGIYGVLLSGWSANSKYPFIGSLRSTAQMISYSCSISLLLLTVAIVAGYIDLLPFLNLNLLISLLPVGLLFGICLIAETNRAPFDLPEAESELVAGFFTEHSAVTFAYFFLGEFTNILAMSTLYFVLFLGSSMALPLVLIIMWIRASLARLRFDQLHHLGWKVILPFAMSAIILGAALKYLIISISIYLKSLGCSSYSSGLAYLAYHFLSISSALFPPLLSNLIDRCSSFG